MLLSARQKGGCQECGCNLELKLQAVQEQPGAAVEEVAALFPESWPPSRGSIINSVTISPLSFWGHSVPSTVCPVGI